MKNFTEKQKELFKAVRASRIEDLKTYKKRNNQGVWRSIIDKYPEAAHFIYELLQNADDTEATKVMMKISPNAMYFKHNGKKHFDITDDEVEPHGDINAITGIGFTTKSDTQNKIGKFGVGFKAVFQYTDAPEIYDDTFNFRIDNYIVPTIIEEEHPLRNEGETLFVFPFKNPEKAYTDIVKRVETLKNPILFLSHLEKIRIEIVDKSGKIKNYVYSKKLQQKKSYKDGTFLKVYKLINPIGSDVIYLFGEKVHVIYENIKAKHTIYVGFYYDSDKEKLLTERKQDVYCFFPTRENFNACYVCHAPFLLTDSRQNIKDTETVNEILIKNLANLAAKAVLHLRDYGISINKPLLNENILDIIPKYFIKSPNNRQLDKYDGPFIDAFVNIINKQIFISRKGKYLSKKEAYIGQPRELVELLSSEQLKDLRGDNNEIDFLKWELMSKLSDCDLIKNRYYSSLFAIDITPEFMNKQDIKWVSKMYTFLRTAAPKLWKFQGIESRKETANLPFRKAPIIKIQSNEWVAPYINNTTPNVFIPINTEQSSEYNFIHKEYMEDEMSVKFFQELEIQVPNELDYIRLVIKKYKGDNIDIDDSILLSDMDILLNYYKHHNAEEQLDFIKQIKDHVLLVNEESYLQKPTKLYLGNEILRKYCDNKKELFININFYKNIIEKYGKNIFEEFVTRLGISKIPRILKRTGTQYYSPPTSLPQRTREQIKQLGDIQIVECTDCYLDHFEQILTNGEWSKELSLYLWNEVLPCCNLKQHEYLQGQYKLAYQKVFRSLPNCYNSSLKYDLLYSAWIYDNNDNLVSPKEIVLEDLSREYSNNQGLIEFLEIQKRVRSILELGATEKEQQDLETGTEFRKLFEELGLSEDEAKAILKRHSKKEVSTKQKGNDIDGNAEDKETDIETMLQEKWNKKANSNIAKPKHTISNDYTEFEITSHTYNSENNEPFFDETASYANLKSTEVDKNDTKKVEKKLESKNTEAQEAAKKATEQKQIYELLKETPQYTFKWYKLLMELMHADKSNISCRHLQIDFSEKEFTCDDKILHLSNPTQPVPSWILDAEKVSISTLSDCPKKIEGVVVKVDDVSIYISVEATAEMKGICNAAKKIRIIADNSTNIIDSLETRFIQLGYEDDYDVNENLTKDIEFIYGPPGTGKTTRLVKMVSDILKFAKGKMNILVLTPTNKAADVVAEKMVNESVCCDYLTRFGATESLYLIEEAAVVSNRDTFDITAQDKNVVVTTAARYAYDYIQPDETFLCDYNWDYIIIDEASMVDILTCTYILHKGLLSKFIISGDPKQIPPVTQNDMPEYNIYDMVGLNDFSEAVNSYTRYNVITLKTQYRSIPAIGDLVSRFTYNGILKADPQRAPQKPLKLDKMNINNINFIGFDIIDFDLIKGLTSIFSDSAFQLYSVIFTYKFAEYIIKQITEKYTGQEYSIGIVSPYRAEADAIKQLLEIRPISTEYCSVTCGTVHGFQGDECDIMLIVLNPPLKCSKGSHVNNQNIINVAMSRARDYLFFIMPQGQPNGMIIKEQLGRLVPSTERAIFFCSDIEEIMFGNRNHIVSNTHVTCHMPVNVYYEENSIFEVRISNEALDIKVNE